MTLSLLLASAPMSHALDCEDGALSLRVPAEGAADQPRNVRPSVALTGFEGRSFGLRLFDMWGDVVPTRAEHERSEGASWCRLTPDRLLAEGEAYSVELYAIEGDVEVVEGAWSFEVGAWEDHEPPPAPSVLAIRSARSSDAWGETSTLEVDLSPVADESAVIYRLEIGAGEETPLVRYTLDAEARFSEGPCAYDRAGALGVEDVWVRAAAVDAAGNSVDPDAAASGPPPGGCAAAAAPTAIWGLALLALWRRRARAGAWPEPSSSATGAG